MKKYFYTNGTDKLGPFSLEELKSENLTRETKIWFYGLDNWTKLSDISELDLITKSIPPPLKAKKLEGYQKNNEFQEVELKEKIFIQNPKKRIYSKNVIKIFILSAAVISIGCIAYFKIKVNNENKFHKIIADSAYDSNVDFDFYINKFYRDIENYGLYPKKPKIKIIKFAKLDQINDATHIHGISYGSNDDDKIEIYINPSTWDKYNKPMRYFLMYHELSHDILNVDDLDLSTVNEGELMYPAIASYESKTMDDFIESSHALFEKLALKK